MPAYQRRLIFFSVVAVIIGMLASRTNPNLLKKLPTPSPTPEPPFTTYSPPKLPDMKVYKIVLVGDSMTHALGPHGGRLLDWLQEKFKGKGFIIDNYSYSTNILSLPDFLYNETKTWNLTFPPILSREFDVIIIESFGYNPLSDRSREEGLQKQREVLNKTMNTLVRAKPNSLVMFLATIAPNKTHYAQKTSLTQDVRLQEVEERVAYIKNHIAYARITLSPLSTHLKGHSPPVETEI